MPITLCYSRNRSTSVEQIDDQTMTSTCCLQDSLTEAMVHITVRFPELEIISAEGRVTRSSLRGCHNVEEALQKVKGVRIGPGMKKIINGLLGEVTDCKELPFMVEECCHGIILAFTKDALDLAPDEEEQTVDFFKDMVKKNIRLYNRCAAFAPGSPLVNGLDPC